MTESVSTGKAEPGRVRAAPQGTGMLISIGTTGNEVSALMTIEEARALAIFLWERTAPPATTGAALAAQAREASRG